MTGNVIKLLAHRAPLLGERSNMNVKVLNNLTIRNVNRLAAARCLSTAIADHRLKLNSQIFHCQSVATMATAPKTLTLDNMNPHIKTMEYAVRGPMLIRAAQIERELEQVITKFHVQCHKSTFNILGNDFIPEIPDDRLKACKTLISELVVYCINCHHCYIL